MIPSAHIGQGSSVVYRVVPANRQSETVCAACLSAIISACPVGSQSISRRLRPRANSFPLRTTTLPTGTSRPHCPASSSARDIQYRSSLRPAPCASVSCFLLLSPGGIIVSNRLRTSSLPSFDAGRTALDLNLSYVLDFAVEKLVAVYRTIRQPAR